VSERVPSPAPSSLLGQPPSVLNIDSRIGDLRTESADLDLDPELQKLYEGYQLEQNFILDEDPDDKQTFLMDGMAFLLFIVPRVIYLCTAPSLPQPNDFRKDFIGPKSLSDCVATKKLSNISLLPRQFLKKVKGCQSLSLELSWVSVQFLYFVQTFFCKFLLI